jgi:hypothetical protein
MASFSCPDLNFSRNPEQYLPREQVNRETCALKKMVRYSRDLNRGLRFHTEASFGGECAEIIVEMIIPGHPEIIFL